MAIALDVAVLLIIVVTFIVVMIRGFVKTVLDFASVVFAIIGAKLFAAELSDVFYKPFYNSFSEGLREVVKNIIEKGDLPALLEQHNVSEILGRYNAPLADSINSGLIEDTVLNIVQNVVGLLSYAIAFLLIFIVVYIICKLLSLLICAVFKLPVLKTINKTLSFFLALLMIFVYLNLFVAFMQIAVPIIASAYPDVVTLDTLNNTFLFKFFYNFEWIKFFVS